MYWVIDEAGNAVKTRALNSRPQAERWDTEKLMNVIVTPGGLRVRPDAQAVPLGDPVPKQPMDIKDVVINPRRLKITMKMLDEHGTTQNCPQCEHVRAFREAKLGLAHTEACRARLMDELGNTDVGRTWTSRCCCR